MVENTRRDYMELPYLYGSAILIILFLASVSAPISSSKLGIIVPVKETTEELPMYNPSAFNEISVKAKAYVVYDLVEKKVIASKNAEETLPLASITKVMTAVTALTHHNRDTKISIKPESIEGGYDMGLKKGQVWELDELLKYTLVFSSNDGAQAVANGLGGKSEFVAKMNTDSALHGLGLTFTDPAGLDSPESFGGSGTALDVAKLFAIARRLYPEVLESTTKTRLTVNSTQQRISGVPNTNQEVEHLFGAEASKTGYTDKAGGNLGVVVDISLGRPVAIIVLGSTREARFSDTEKLYQALLRSMK